MGEFFEGTGRAARLGFAEFVASSYEQSVEFVVESACVAGILPAFRII